jgi:hypothetical protein
MSLRVVDRFRPHARRVLQQALDDGSFHKREELALLAPELLGRLSLWSLIMFIIGAIFFIAFTIAMSVWQTHSISGLIGGLPLLLWIVINIVGSILILGVHEIIHGLAFMLWGGMPYYGAKLPFALYCSARNQLFPRDYYLVVGLAPFVVITLAAMIFTIVSPVLASYGLLAWISNFAGAAGDIFTIFWLLRQPRRVLVEDTETGCRVWERL